MYSKNTLRLIKSPPQKLKTVHKCPRTLMSLLQRTTNQITPLAFTLETHQNYSRLTPMLKLLIQIESLKSLRSLE